MSSQGKPSGEGAKSAPVTAPPKTSDQLDFELEFFGHILDAHPGFVDVLRVQSNNLTLKGRFADGLQVDRRLVVLRPGDALAHYNLACKFALLRKVDLALKTLRKAVELGYRDFRFIREDRDLDAVRNDPRYRMILREFESR